MPNQRIMCVRMILKDYLIQNLQKNGEIQSRHLAEFLQKGRHLSDEEFKNKNKPLDIIYCSAMKRSLETTRPIAKCNRSSARNLVGHT